MVRWVIGLALLGMAAAPPAVPTPEQEHQLRERDRHFLTSLTARKDGRPSEAIAALEKAVASNVQVNGLLHRYTESRHRELAQLRKSRGEWGPAAEHYRRAAEALEVLNGGGHWRTIDARLDLEEMRRQAGRTPQERAWLAEATRLNVEVAALYRRGEAKKALPLAERALKLRREVLGQRHLDHAAALNNLAALHRILGNHKAALPLYQQALKTCEEVVGRRHPSYAVCLSNVAGLHRDMGDHKAALSLYRQALKVRTEVLGRHVDTAFSLHALAALYRDMGDHRSALPLARQALELREELLGRRHPDHASSLNGLALLHSDLGEHQEALQLLRQALKLREEMLGRRHPLYAESLNNLAAVYRATGDHKAALPLYRQALKVHEEVLGRRHPSYASSLNNLALVYQDLGDYKGALPLLRQALKLREEVLGRRHPAYVASLNNLATLHYKLRDHKAALPLFQQARRLCEEVLGRRHPHYATSLNNLAELHLAMGDHRAALPLLRQALTLDAELRGRRHPDYATTLSNLGVLYHRTRDHSSALPLFQQALTLREEVLDRLHPDYAISLSNLARLYHDLGRPGAALPYQEQAIVLTRRKLSADAAVLSERQQLAAAADLRHHLSVRLSMPDESAQFSHAHVLAWKGAAFATQQARRAYVRLQGDETTRDLAAEVLDATRELALLSSRTDRLSRARMEELTRIKDDREGRLAALSEPFRAARTSPSSETVRQLLPDGVVLIDLLAYNGYDPARPITEQKPQPRLAAWVVRGDRPIGRVDLGPMRPIEEAITAWRTALEKGEDSDRGVRLRRLVWQPLEKHLAGAKVVLLSPDGAVAKLPFAALPGSRPGTYLLEEVALASLPVPRMLPNLLTAVEGKASLLTLGGVAFDADLKGRRRERAKDDLTWSALPGTLAEANTISTRFEDHKAALSGKDATKDAVRAALTRHRYAHLATHGYFAPESMRSALERTDDRADSLFQREGVSGWHPGLLSGLVLAGANRPTEEDDGVLTALEIAELDLSGLELAVLSACETGLGLEAGGEGLLGLQRAFAVAGCRSVVSSLWSVNDAATTVLMERFYHHLWQKKASKLEALRQAQLDVLRNPTWVEERAKTLVAGKMLVRGVGKASAALPKSERRSPPAWWAAWQLSGDWR